MTLSSTFRSSTRAAAGLVALVLTIAGAAGAQVGADSSGRATPPADSTRGYLPSAAAGDSAAGASDSGGISRDTTTSAAARGDSAAAISAPGTAGAPGTGIQPPSRSTGPVVTVVGPPDTTLMGACAGAEAGTEAPGLLAVVFQPGTPEKERAAAARAVGGKLAGSNEYGEDYVRVPASAGALAAVADRLIRQGPVTRVSPAPCPGPMPVPATSPTTPAGESGVKPGAANAPGAATDSARGGARDSAQGAVTAPVPGAQEVPGAPGDTARKAPAMSP